MAAKSWGLPNGWEVRQAATDPSRRSSPACLAWARRACCGALRLARGIARRKSACRTVFSRSCSRRQRWSGWRAKRTRASLSRLGGRLASRGSFTGRGSCLSRSGPRRRKPPGFSCSTASIKSRRMNETRWRNRLRRFAGAVASRGYRVLVTSRPLHHGIGTLAPAFADFQLLPFNGDQRHDLAARWLGDKADAFLNALDDIEDGEIRRYFRGVFGRGPWEGAPSAYLISGAARCCLRLRLPTSSTMVACRPVPDCVKLSSAHILEEAGRRGLQAILGQDFRSVSRTVAQVLGSADVPMARRPDSQQERQPLFSLGILRRFQGGLCQDKPVPVRCSLLHVPRGWSTTGKREGLHH